MQRVIASALFCLALAGCSSGGGDPTPGNPAPPANPAPAPNPSPTPNVPPPSALFVLGDSLSDVGNAASAADYLLNVAIDPPTVGLCNPADVLVLRVRCDDLFYRQSRVSDGPVAVEALAAHFGLAPLRPSLHLLPTRTGAGTAYAVASAKAREPGDEDLRRQVDWLLLDHAVLPAAAVYVVMIGGNDVIDALQADLASPAVNPRPSAAIVGAAVDAIGVQVERLLDFGARRIVIANVPDLAALPAVRTAAAASPDPTAALAAARAISSSFNAALAAKLTTIETRNLWPTPFPATLVRFDLYAALAAAGQATTARGGNALAACFDSDAYRASANAVRVFHSACAPLTPTAAPRFGEFVFFDGIHPTGAAHAALGTALRALF